MIEIKIIGDNVGQITSDLGELQQLLTGTAPVHPVDMPLDELIELTKKAAKIAGFDVNITAPDAVVQDEVKEELPRKKARAKAALKVVAVDELTQEFSDLLNDSERMAELQKRDGKSVDELVEEDLEAFKKHWLPIMQDTCFKPGGNDIINGLRKKFGVKSFTDTEAERYPEIVAAYREKMGL